MAIKNNPEWTEKDFAKATKFKRGTSLAEATKVMVAKRGRPTHGERAKVPLSLRIDPLVLEAYKGTGDGWQGRMNEVLERGAKRLSK